MGRITTNDHLIDDLIANENFKILKSGKVLTQICLSGYVRPGVWREKHGTHVWRGKAYSRIRYKGQFLFVHRIIYRKFIGILESTKVVNHKDGNGLNNHPSNLELITKAENNQHRFKGKNL